MKVVVCTADALLQHYLHLVLGEAEGVAVAFAEELEGPPDGEPGWVIAMSTEDPVAPSARELLREDWVAGVALFRTGNSTPVRTSREGPYRDAPGLVEINMPCGISEVVEGLLAAETGGRSVAEAEPDAGPILLVAEDSLLQRQMIVTTLKSEGYTVLDAEDGSLALALLKRNRCDLVLTDVEMPNMTGLEFTRAIREDPALREIPVLMLTTLSGFDQIKEGFDAGASDYLVKPKKGEREMFLEELLSRVLGLLQQVRAENERQALVVDDSRMTRQMVASAMTRAGFAVTTASDGMEAKGLLENPALELPEIVVTDLEMPVMDGLRLTHYIKHSDRTRELPVIILSASTDHEHRVLGRGFGVDAFISKPFSDEKLLVTVDQVLGRNRLEIEKRELSKIMGRDVVKAIHGEGLQARTRELTILFSDLAGFSKMCFGMDAGQVVELLNDYFDRLVDFVLREQGYVNKFIGDAVMALFSPLPGLDAPHVRAARAAVAFQREMVEVNDRAEQPLLTRIGINTGEVIMGLIGGGERRDYTVIGDDVNRAQRLESQAPVGGVLLSAGTYEIARDYLGGEGDLTVTPVDGLKLKGIARPVTAYAVTMKEQE